MAETWKGMTLSGSPYDPYVREVWKTLGTADEGTKSGTGFWLVRLLCHIWAKFTPWSLSVDRFKERFAGNNYIYT